MLVQDLVQNSAERFPDKTALVCDGQRLTYAEIEARANRLAHALIAHGVQRGDRVVVYLPNSVEAVVAIFAILKAAGTFVVVNVTTKRDKLVYILNNCQATALFTSGRNASLAAEVHAAVPSLEFTVLSGKRAAPRPPSVPPNFGGEVGPPSVPPQLWGGGRPPLGPPQLWGGRWGGGSLPSR